MKRTLTFVLLLFVSALSDARAQTGGASALPLQKGHKIAVLEVDWSPDDRLLLTYSAGDGYLSVWEMPEGRLRWRVADSDFVKEKGDDRRALRAFAWSDDGRFIATGCENGTVQVWDAADGRMLWKSRVAAEYVAGVGFSHDGKLVAASAAPEDEEFRLALFDARGGAKLKELEGMGKSRPHAPYYDDRLLFSADDRELNVGDRRAIVTRWDVDSGRLIEKRELNPCAGAKRSPDSFAYARDLSFLAARCVNLTVLTDARTGEVMRTHATGYETKSIAVSRDANVVASGDLDGFKILNLKSGEELSLKEQPPISCGCDFNRDATLFAFTDYLDNETVKVVDVKSGRTVMRLEAHPGKVHALAFSNDGSALASASEDRIVRVWDAATGRLLAAFEGHAKPVQSLAFSPDGSTLVSGSEDQTIKVWDVRAGSLLRSIEADQTGISAVSSAAFSPDGKKLVTAQGVTVSLWDASTWKLLQTFKTNESHKSGETESCCGSDALYVRFSADGTRIISGHADGTVKVWKEGSAKPLRVVRTGEGAESFALSLDEKRLASNPGEEPPRVWNWATSKRLATLGEDADYAHGLAFSPDGRRLASSDVGGGLYVWDSASGKLLLELDGGLSGDDALAFSPDGARLASGGDNQNIIVWDAQTGRRLWSILPVQERYRPTPEEVAEREEETRRAEEEKRHAAEETDALAPKLFVTFEHYGEPRDPAQTRIVETAKPDKSLKRQSKSEATGVWLRLHNDSTLPVSIWTESSYLPGGERCGYDSAKRFYYGLCEGAEIGIRIGVLDAKGKPVRYGFDFGGISMIPPKTSVLFSLPRGLLAEGRTIYIRYNFMKEDARGKLAEYGETREIKLTATLLP